MSDEAKHNLFDGLTFYFIQKKLSKVQHEIVREKIIKFGGDVVDNFSSTITHAVFPRNVTLKQGLESMKLTVLPNHIVSISMDWVSRCIAKNKRIPTTSYEVRLYFARSILTQFPNFWNVLAGYERPFGIRRERTGN